MFQGGKGVIRTNIVSSKSCRKEFLVRVKRKVKRFFSFQLFNQDIQQKQPCLPSEDLGIIGEREKIPKKKVRIKKVKLESRKKWNDQLLNLS